LNDDLTLLQVLETHSDGPNSGVFTDGSARPNPGPGGWGFVWVVDGQPKAHRFGHVEESTTNNRMELQALIEAYRFLPESAELTIYSDSQLCVNTINQWAKTWERNGWRRKTGPIKNLDLVQDLFALAQAHSKVTLTWIKAHAGLRWNAYADSLASAWDRAEL
jgi:ribonuclease HI